MRILRYDSNHPRGMAIVVVLGMLLIGIGLMIGFMKGSARFNQNTLQKSAKLQSDLRTDSLSDRVRRAILQEVQLRMAETGTTQNTANLSGTNILNSDSLINLPIDQNQRILSIRCIGQGPNPSGVCNSQNVLPKIYDFAVQTSDPDTGTITVAHTEFQIQNASLSSYAFFIKNELAPTITLGSAIFDGIFGINFAPTPAGQTPPPDQRVRFRPGAGNIIFKNVLMTNLSNPQTQFDMQQGSQVQFEQGVVSQPEGVSFSNLDNLHSTLINRAISSGFSAPAGSAEPECSSLILQSDGKMQYNEFSDINCEDSSFQLSEVSMASNQAFYARGNKVFLSSNDPQGLTQVKNIAIVARGNVELRSSIVRDQENLSSLEGYPTVITPGNLIVPKEMRTLLNSGTSTLGDIANPGVGSDIEEPTIQLDLSYISVRPQGSQGLMGGSVVFDPALRNAGTSYEATNLGRAHFNGLYISEQTPTSRILFQNSDRIDGFSDVKWTYPPALSAIGTDWFQTQLNGGALRATITRYEKQLTNLQQALGAFPDRSGSDVEIVGINESEIR
jgi:hypothetical protein